MMSTRWRLLATVALLTSRPSAAAAAADAGCPDLDARGPFVYSKDETVVITFTAASRTPVRVVFNVTCAPPSGWATATATMPAPFTAFEIQFDERPPLSMPGYLDASCTVISFGDASAPWCAASNRNCTIAPDPWWAGGFVHLVQVSHSDVGWLGAGTWGLPPDLIDDTDNMLLALDMMAADPGFAWQHECVLFLRVFVDMYPSREAELVARIAEGRFDIGGTYTEGLESTQLNELMARQLYSGRKWFVERYPGLDSAIVAFHQDGPLRAIQAPQVWAKAGVRYLKASRWSDAVLAWRGADDASAVLALTEVHYGQAAATVADVQLRMQQAGAAYRAAGLPPQHVQALGTDYSPPTNDSALLASWAALPPGASPRMGYSTFKRALRALDVGAPGLRSVRGERPNLWYMEGAPTHHRMFTDLREGARALPAAETWSTFRAAVEGSWTAYPAAALAEAWLNLTLNDHGIAGEPTPRNFSLPPWFVNERSPPSWDLVYADKWARAAAAGAAAAADAQAFLAARVNASGRPPGAASVTVFNRLSWEVDAPARTVVAPCPPGGARGAALTDADTGEAVAAQLAHDDATNCTLVFTAFAVPAFGFRVYWVAPPPPQQHQQQPATAVTATASPAAALPAPGDPWTTPYSNRFYTLTPAPGGLASMRDLDSGSELFDTSALLAGEWVSLTYTGQGASETREYAHPVADATFQRLSNVSTPATWSCVESGGVRVVFATAPARTAHSTVSLELAVYAAIKRVDLRVVIAGWDSAFGVANRVVFPVATRARNVTYAAPFGVVRVGVDEAENGTDDVWMTSPGPDVPLFERAWAMHPREVADWVHADAGGAAAGVLVSSPVGVFDFADCTGRYPATVPVLAPELLLHTDSNRGPFLPEPGDHVFDISLHATAPGRGWADGWRAGVVANNALAAVWRPAAAPPAPDAWLPPRAGLLSVDGDGGGAWVTAVKMQDAGGTGAPPRAGVVARVFNVDGVDRAGVALRWDAPGRGGGGAAALRGAARVNLIELEPADIPGVAGTSSAPLPGGLGHWAIETLLLDAGIAAAP